MKVQELINKLIHMAPDIDVIVWNGKEELTIATNVTSESLWYGEGNGWIERYHTPRLKENQKDAVVIE